MTVSAGSIVERFDVVEDIDSGEIARFLDTSFDMLFLQTTKERLDDRVVPAVTATTHARLKFVVTAKS